MASGRGPRRRGGRPRPAPRPGPATPGRRPGRRRRATPRRLAHHQLGRGGQLVDDAHLGDLRARGRSASVGAPQVDDGADAGAADGDVGEAAPPRPAEGVARRSPRPRRRARPRSPSRMPAGRAVAVLGQQRGPAVVDVGQVDAGVGAHEPVLGLADDEVAAPAQDAHRLAPRRSALWPSGSSGSIGTSWPSAFDTTFWVTTTTSPSREVGHGRRRSGRPGRRPGAPRGCPRRAGSRAAHVGLSPEPARGSPSERHPAQCGGVAGVAHDRVGARRSARPRPRRRRRASASASSITSVPTSGA